ncbi:Cdc6/Cdc18 family protein [Halocatena pleomorpha]|uniref:ORC1-type DNA replication protein n=1 Tax=Halocatena pleomorpha TaxID=1785090 RepID=A0A3P3RDW1_9EURY|nr:orc1/cdc6 family replication initiation protein [Halocatena pleomorpha]RRJ30643.1 cell division control protein Cdc6 [Halocatena pleomorpha]
MGLEPFTPGDAIFEDEDILRDSHQPETLLEREDELKEYQSALQPIINGARPRNIFLYGQTGVGKTVATDMIIDRLQIDQEKIDNLDIHAVNIICKNLTTSYQVAVKLANRFRSKDERLPPTGYPPDTVYEFLWEHLKEIDSTHVLLILDEIDAVGEDDNILYELPRCNDNGNVPPEMTKVGVIGISNNFTFREQLSARVTDSLCDEEIHFPPYDSDQLRSILRQRAKRAFIDDVLEDDVIPLTAAIAGQESGSARQALKLLFKAGDIARSDGAESVDESHVREAEPLIKEGKVKSELQSLPAQSHVTLYALLRLHAKDELPAKTGKIYEEYKKATSHFEAEEKTDRTIRNRLNQLSLKGFLSVDEKNMGARGGSYYVYQFGVRPKLIQNVLENLDRVEI